MRLIKLNKQNAKKAISQTINVLKNGGLVVFPSDTVYGLLADATNEEAVKKLTKFKQRPAGKPISVFVPNVRTIELLCNVNKPKLNILYNILPGPFTIVLDYKKGKKSNNISSLLLSENKTLGVRYPDFELIQLLVSKFKKPITATSANLSGEKPVYSIESLFKQISIKKKDLLDLVVDAGKLPYNKPSTVIDLTSDRIRQLRKGDLIFSDSQSYISKSPDETKKIAKRILKDHIKRINIKPLVLILKGPLGAGKTIFAKGLGEYLGINNIISPSFVIYYEYEIINQKSKLKSQKFIHGDLYNVQDDKELANVDLERYLIPGNIICIEWGEKSSQLVSKLTSKAKVLYIDISYLGRKKRGLVVNSVGKNK